MTLTLTDVYNFVKPMADALGQAIADFDAKINYIRAAIYDAGTATWLKGAGVPGAGLGTDGNYYTDTTANKVYKKVSGAWILQAVGGGGGSLLTTKGDLLGFSTLAGRVPVGTDGQVLTADSTQSFGFKWAAGGIAYLTGTTAPLNTLGNNGDIYLDTVALMLYGPKTAGTWGTGTAFEKPLTFSGALLRTGNAITVAAAGITNAMLAGAIDLTTKVTGLLPIANGGTNAGTKTAAFNNLAPLTTKGDLIVRNGTDGVRLGVGTDTYVLTADSSTTEGVKWLPAGGVAGLTTISATWGGYNNTAITFPLQNVAKFSAISGVIQKVVILTEGTGSCEVDIWKVTAASFPPTAGNSICGGNYPTITAGNVLVDSTLTGWTLTVNPNDTFLFHLRSCSGFTYVTIILYFG